MSVPGPGARAPRLRLVADDERAAPAPARGWSVPQWPGGRTELSAAEAAIMLGVSEDDVLARQRTGELPPRLTWNRLQGDARDEFTGPP